MDAATSLVGTTAGSTLLAVGVMQWFKKAKWFPFLQEGNKILNRTVSIVVAGLIALGIHATFVGSADVGWTFSGTIPSVWQMATALFHWGQQYIYQETGYTFLSALTALSTIASVFQNPQQGAASDQAQKDLQAALDMKKAADQAVAAAQAKLGTAGPK